MSLQPGPEDPTENSALTPQEPGTGTPTPPPPAAPTWQMPPTGATPPQGGYQAPPPPPAPGAPAAGPYGAPAPGPYGSYAGPPGAPAPSPYGTPGQGYGGAQPPGSAFPPPTGTPGYPPGYPTGYPPPGYQTLGYPPPQTDSKAVVGLIMAITSWVLCPVVLAVVALVLASQSSRAIAVSGGRLEGRSMNTATKWISWINIVLYALAGIAFIAFLAWAATQDPSTWDSYLDPSTQF